MTKTELLWAYEEYCVDCESEGYAPVSYWKWRDMMGAREEAEA